MHRSIFCQICLFQCLPFAHFFTNSKRERQSADYFQAQLHVKLHFRLSREFSWTAGHPLMTTSQRQISRGGTEVRVLSAEVRIQTNMKRNADGSAKRLWIKHGSKSFLMSDLCLKADNQGLLSASNRNGTRQSPLLRERKERYREKERNTGGRKVRQIQIG